MLHVISLAGLTLAGGAEPGAAQDSAPPGFDYETCNETAYTTIEMRDCNRWEHERQDRRLNNAYRELIRRHLPEAQEDLRRAQRAWLEFREAECLYEATGNMEGTIGPVLVGACWASMTKQRADELEAYLARDRELND